MDRPSIPAGGRPVTSAASRERVVIPNQHGEKLVGILHETGSKELVVICHGFRSSKDRIPMAYLADTLEKEGISAFRFDFAGNGESEGSFQFGNYRREAGDLHDVVQHFMRNQRIVAAVVGHSKGGNVVLLYASIYNDVRTVINISGRFNLENGIEARLGKGFQQRIRQNGYIDINNKRGKFIYRVTEESLMDRLTTDTLTSASSIPKDCWVLTIHGSRDEVVSPADALEFSKFIHNHQLHIIEGADHEYTSHQLELACVVLNFIRAGLMRESAIQEHSLVFWMDSKPSQRNDRRNVATENGLRKIFIQKSDGKKLVGILHETGSKEVVIICHGFRSSKDCAPVVNLAAALESQSISAFRFDFPGYGESEEPFQLDISLRNPDVLHDVVQHFVKNKRIVTAIVGHSQGGCDALRYASKYNHVRTVVNISGWINLAKAVEAMFGKAVFEEIRQKGFVDVKNKKGEVWIHATQEQWMEMQRVDIRSEVLLISEDCRVLTVHGSKDEVVSPADSFEYAKLIRNHKLHIIEGADHEYTSHQGELASAVLNFIKQGSWRQEGASILSRI